MDPIVSEALHCLDASSMGAWLVAVLRTTCSNNFSRKGVPNPLRADCNKLVCTSIRPSLAVSSSTGILEGDKVLNLQVNLKDRLLPRPFRTILLLPPIRRHLVEKMRAKSRSPLRNLRFLIRSLVSLISPSTTQRKIVGSASTEWH